MKNLNNMFIIKNNDVKIKIIYTLLILLLVLILILGFLSFTKDDLFKVNGENTDKKQEDVPPIVEVSHTKMEASYFENILDETIDISYLENGLNDIENLTNQDKLVLLFFANNDYLKEINQINKDIVDKYFKNNYNTTVIHENIKCDINSETEEYCYIYDEKNMIYTENFTSDLQKEEILGKYMNRRVYAKTTYYTQENNTYKLTRYELYKSACYSDCNLVSKYYSNVKDANNESSPLLTLSKKYDEKDIIDYNTNKMYSLIIDTNFDIYINLMVSHHYTFKKTNDNYVLVDYQINRLD